MLVGAYIVLRMRTPLSPRSLAVAVAIALVVAVLLPRAEARSDQGAWLWFEYRQPVVGEADRFPRLSWRVSLDSRFLADRGGLAQQFLRTGPLVDVTSWLYIAIHGTSFADLHPDGVGDREYRFELEPTFQGRLGDFTWSDRNRFEYRWRETVQRTRYRNQLRVNYAPVGARWIPFVWNEALIDLSAGYNENRLFGGLARMLAPNIRLEGGYLLRSRSTDDGWAQDHVGVLSLFIGWPPAK